ncbi:GNAT family N-acetyltransferase [Acidobacteriota bacterium]
MVSLLKKIRSKHKHGLLAHTLSHKIGQKGLRIYPYYLIQERKDTDDPPDIKDNIEEYTFQFMVPEDIEILPESEELSRSKSVFRKRLDKGNKCFCAQHHGQIVAYTWFDFEACRFIEPLFNLKENEAYLFDMYTLKSHRGKNIAPHLRYKSYEALNEMGRDTFFSISEYFNAPAIKFKKKLNAKFLGTYIMFDLYRKWKGNLRIRGDKIRKKN